MLGVTVVGDVVVLILFTLSCSIALAQCSGAGFEGGAFLITILTLCMAVGIGYLQGGLIIFLMWVKVVPARFTVLPIGFLTFICCDWFAEYTLHHWGVSINFDALLICITAGYVVTNQSKNRVAFLHLLGSSATYIFIPFFTKVGVELNLKVFIESIGFAILVFLMRVICVAIGSYIGGHFAGLDHFKKMTIWGTMLAQAGVSLGLASEVRVKFPDWGSDFQTTIIAVVLINQFIGPVACKYTLRKHGEAGMMGEEEEEEHDGPKFLKRALIVGIDSKSIAVAQRLLNANWAVTLLDFDKNKLKMVNALITDSPTITKSMTDPHGGAAHGETKEGETSTGGGGGGTGESRHDAESSVGGDELSSVRAEHEDSVEGAPSNDDLQRDSFAPDDEKSTTNLSANSASSKNRSAQHHIDDDTENTISGGADSELRIQTALIPQNFEQTIGELVSSLLVESTLTHYQCALIYGRSDQETYDISLHLQEAHHLPRLTARLYNPVGWSALFKQHGIIPEFDLSTLSHVLYKTLTSKQQEISFGSTRGGNVSLAEQLEGVMKCDDDYQFIQLEMSSDEQLEYQHRYPPPSTAVTEAGHIAAVDAMKAGVKMTTVASGLQRDHYLSSLEATHANEDKVDRAKEEQRNEGLVLGMQALKQQDKRRRQKSRQNLQDMEDDD